MAPTRIVTVCDVDGPEDTNDGVLFYAGFNISDLIGKRYPGYPKGQPPPHWNYSPPTQSTINLGEHLYIDRLGIIYTAGTPPAAQKFSKNNIRNCQIKWADGDPTNHGNDLCTLVSSLKYVC